MVKKLEGAGLRGQVAGETSLSTVGQIEGLAYRGHKVETLADKASFEEVAYLLLYNKLPNKSELSEYKALLKSQRDLPQALKEGTYCRIALPCIPQIVCSTGPGPAHGPPSTPPQHLHHKTIAVLHNIKAYRFICMQVLRLTPPKLGRFLCHMPYSLLLLVRISLS